MKTKNILVFARRVLSDNPADYTLDSSPVGVRIDGDLNDQAYTFCVYKN